MEANTHYIQPAGADSAMNRVVVWLTRRGISVYGSRVLRVRGRTSGRWHSVPVNPLRYGGRRYLVAPRGQTQWVRNLRVAGTGELVVGRRVEAFPAVEIPDGQKADVLRHYLKRWAWEVGKFFDGVNAKAPDTELQRIASRHPVFEITTAPSAGA